ncbi:MAG: hypothetical protein ACK40G_12060 [Cytophagaceae bacterium]
MKKTILSIFSFLVIFSLFVISCKKKDQDPKPDNTEYTNTANDQANVNVESDEIANMADDAFTNSELAGARLNGTSTIDICGASADVNTSTKKITLTFDGETPCVNNTRKRSGVIEIQLTNGDNWNQQGAVINITFNNYKVTRISDGKSVVFNGSKSITNVNGGLIRKLIPNVGSVTHKIESNNAMTLTFDDGTQRVWSTNRTRVITKTGTDQYSGSVTGNATVATDNNVAFWGTNRKGNAFRTVLNTELLWSTCTGAPRIISGQATHKGPLYAITVTYGVNQDGSVATPPSCSSYGYKLNWVGLDGKPNQAVVSY